MKVLVACLALLCFCPSACCAQSPVAPERERDDLQVFIHGATFQMGIDASEIPRFQKIFNIDHPQLLNDELPKHTVTVADFYLDKHLVTNSEFRSFIAANPRWDRSKPSESAKDDHYLIHWSTPGAPNAQSDHPVVNITWHAAKAFCQWEGKRLPTEVEWEFAARGGRAALFPWGDEPPEETRANYNNVVGTTTPVTAYPPNPYGLFDMAGNVWQFLADEWAPYRATLAKKQTATDSSEESPSRQATPLPEARRVIRGGSFAGHPINLWLEYRDSHDPNNPREYVGFRCAKSPSAKTSP